MNPAIRISNVSKRYRLGEVHRHWTIGDKLAALFSRRGTEANGRLHNSWNGAGSQDEIWALKDVSFDVAPGEVVGIIGRNGAGKSTLLKILSRITEPTRGEVELFGRVSSLLEVGTGFHPELTGRDNIYLNGSVLGMKKAEIDGKFDEIVDFSGVARFLDTPVKRYSSGMQVRLAFAVAAHLEPEILIVDEVLAVGDAEFQRKCIGKMGDVATSGRTVLFVSHNLAAVENLCPRVLVLRDGCLDYDGETSSAIAHYLQATSLSERRVEVEMPPCAKQSGIVLRSVSTSNASGKLARQFKTGEDVEISFEFSVAEWAPLKRLSIAIFLRDLTGLLISKCYSEHQSSVPLTINTSGTASCVIRNLRLVPGQYSVGFLVRIGHDVLCSHEQVLRFELQQSDLFGTGKLPRANAGLLLPEVQWKCEETTHHAA